MLLRSGIIAAGSVKPTLVSTLDNSIYKSTVYLKFDAQYGYFGHGTRFTIFDPVAMSVVAEVNDSTHLSSVSCVELSADGNYIFLACEQNASVTVYNISTKSSPTFVQQFKGPTPNTSLNGVSFIKRSGNTLFATTLSRNSVALIDCTDPTNLAWISEFRGPTPGTSLKSCRRCDIDPVNNILYYVCDDTSAGTHRFGAADISTPASPVELWSISNDDVFSSRGVYYVASRNLVFVNATLNTPFLGAVTAYDVSNPLVTPAKVGQAVGFGTATSVTSLEATRSTAFITKGSKIYAAVVAETPDNISLFDWTDAANPVRIGGVKSTTNLNSPLDIQIGPDGYAYAGNFASNSLSVEGVSKWNLNLP